MSETTRDVEATDALDRLEATAISADYADERQVQKDVTTIEAEIRRLRSENASLKESLAEVITKNHRQVEMLERRDAALREGRLADAIRSAPTGSGILRLLLEVRDALRIRTEAGHNDTCSYELTGDTCDCGHDACLRALTTGGETTCALCRTRYTYPHRPEDDPGICRDCADSAEGLEYMGIATGGDE